MTILGRRIPPSAIVLPTLLTRARLARLSVVVAAMLVIVACFAWAGGWLSIGRLDQTRIIDTFEAVNGLHPGFRRNHAKGVCLTGWLDSSGAGARLSKWCSTPGGCRCSAASRWQAAYR